MKKISKKSTISSHKEFSFIRKFLSVLQDFPRINSLKIGGTVLVRRRPCPEAHSHLEYRFTGRVYGPNETNFAKHQDLSTRHRQLRHSPLPKVKPLQANSGTPQPNAGNGTHNPEQKMQNSSIAPIDRKLSLSFSLQEPNPRQNGAGMPEIGNQQRALSSGLVRHSHESSHLVLLMQLDSILRNNI